MRVHALVGQAALCLGGSGVYCARAAGSPAGRTKEDIDASVVADGMLGGKVSNGTSVPGASPSIAMAVSLCVIAYTTGGAITY